MRRGGVLPHRTNLHDARAIEPDSRQNASVRIVGRAFAVGAVLMLTARSACAQSCHAVAEDPRGETRLGLSLRSETATFRTKRYEGHFEGAFATASGAFGPVSAALSVPYYRALENGLAVHGFGDLALGARARVVSDDATAYAFGVMLGTTLPTGDAEDELGMGHAMPAGGLWGRWSAPLALQLRAELSYARAIVAGSGGSHHAHGAGTSPLVDPMNGSELAPLFTVSRPLGDLVTLRAGAFGGFPVGADGASRVLGLIGVHAARGGFAARVEGQAPLIGDPFEEKLLLELSVAR